MGFHVSFRECINIMVPYSLYKYNVWYLTRTSEGNWYIVIWAPVVQRQGEPWNSNCYVSYNLNSSKEGLGFRV